MPLKSALHLSNLLCHVFALWNVLCVSLLCLLHLLKHFFNAQSMLTFSKYLLNETFSLEEVVPQHMDSVYFWAVWGFVAFGKHEEYRV